MSADVHGKPAPVFGKQEPEHGTPNVLRFAKLVIPHATDPRSLSCAGAFLACIEGVCAWFDGPLAILSEACARIVGSFAEHEKEFAKLGAPCEPLVEPGATLDERPALDAEDVASLRGLRAPFDWPHAHFVANFITHVAAPGAAALTSAS